MSTPDSEAPDKLERYELALQRIADQVRQQTVLEAHQRECGRSIGEIDIGRLDAYEKIARIAMSAIGQGRDGHYKGE